MKKSDILLSLAAHLNIKKLLEDYPGLDREGLSKLLKEAADALGPAKLETAKKAGKGIHAGRLTVYTDGASRGNPGEAGIGVLIVDESGHIVKKIARYLGRTTNNQAEYAALLAGLKAAVHLGADDLLVLSDSELMVKQLNGEYRVKDPGLQERFAEVKALMGNFSRVMVEHIPRARNSEADALANEAIDRRLG